MASFFCTLTFSTLASKKGSLEALYTPHVLLFMGKWNVIKTQQWQNSDRSLELRPETNKTLKINPWGITFAAKLAVRVKRKRSHCQRPLCSKQPQCSKSSEFCFCFIHVSAWEVAAVLVQLRKAEKKEMGQVGL